MESQSRCFHEPVKCVLWSNPELARGSQKPLETVTVYEEDSHFRRCLLRCQECGQLYFYEFLEEIDHAHGNDPQYRTYIPVPSAEHAKKLSGLPIWEIAKCCPAIHSDWPEDADKPKVFWIRRRTPGPVRSSSPGRAREAI